MADPANSLKFGRYTVTQELGRGAMGVVYRASDPMIDRVVAIKTITAPVPQPDADGFLKRFFREAQAAGKLTHPNTVTIYDAGQDAHTRAPYIVMEYVDGVTLDAVLRERAPLDLRLAIDYMRQVLAALAEAHAIGIIHRDIKPANLMITPQGRVKVTDFGVAHLRNANFTVEGTPGTPAYMSPAQVLGMASDARSDLFSLGVIFYWMLAGQKPFAGDAPAQVMYQIVYHHPPPPSSLNPALPAEADYVVSRALAKKPEERYASAEEFSSDLEDLGQGKPPRTLAAREPLALASPVSAEATQRTDPLADLPLLSTPAAGTAAAERTLPLPRHRASDIAPHKQIPLPSQPATSPGYTAGRRAAILVSGVALLLLLLWAAWPRPKATIHIECRHNLREAELNLYLGEKLLATRALRGETSNRLGILRRTEGTLMESLQIPAGDVHLRVHIRAPQESFDETRDLVGTIGKDGERTVQIRADGRSNSLSVLWR